MTDGTTRRYNDGEVLSGVQRRRRWTPEEKVRIVEETYLPGMSVSLVARRHGVGGNQIFTWRRLMAQGALTAAAAGEEVVPASEYRALEAQVRELHRLLGKKATQLCPRARGKSLVATRDPVGHCGGDAWDERVTRCLR
jgi:transposase